MLRNTGFSSLWSSQIFGPDTLTVLAIVGRELPDLDLGTAVVPVQPRHPAMLAAQARTVQDAIGGNLSLGIGLSHQVIVEGLWGISFDRPAKYMHEYLDALGPLLRGEAVSVKGERVSAVAMSAVGPKEVAAPSLLVAALGTKMLQMAGAMTDGTVLWMTGVKTIATHIAPTLKAAASAAGRPSPRIVCSLPIVVTDDVTATTEMVNSTLSVYGTLPSYQAMLEREGATSPADVGLLGSRELVLERLHGLAEAGVTEFSASIIGNAQQRDATYEALLDYANGQ